MTIKEQILTLLEEEQGNYLSGERIGDRLQVSRSAIWKAIKDLKKSGYQIDAITNKGYCLLKDADLLSEERIRFYLEEPLSSLNIQVQSSVTSTNALVKEYAAKGEKEGMVLVANHQTQGRGRYGRTFFSPDGSGVYFSILLRPQMRADDAPSLTTLAAVAVARGIEKVFHDSVEIKWVNDLFLNGNKICGILTEGAFDMETNGMEYVVVGIGINVYEPQGGFPAELESIAGSLIHQKEVKKDNRNRLVAECMNYFFQYYYNFSQKKYLDDYKKRSMILGKQIEVIKGEAYQLAKAVDIDAECRLLVEYPDGKQELLSSGEVRIRPVK